MSNVFANIDKNLLKRFKAYHLKHPEIYLQFREMALQIRNTGKTKYSAWTIINVIRWNYDLMNDEVFKINNDFIALYARLFIHHNPHFEGFFELRTMKPFNRRQSNEERCRRAK